MKTLETPRLILRQWTRDDASDLFEYAKSSVVGPMAGWKPHESVDESVKIIDSFIIQDETWAIYHRKDGKVIGSVGIHPDRKRSVDKSVTAMLGYVLAENYWGQGIIYEACREVLRFAFEEMSLEIISLFHYPFNNQSRRIAEKLGFKYEGILRQASTIYNGTIYDDVCYSLRKNEWGMNELSINFSPEKKKLINNIKFRNYRLLSDYDKVSSFLRKSYNMQEQNGYFLQPFFEYAQTHPMFNHKLAHKMGLWESNSEIVAGAFYEMDLGECFLVALPDFKFLLPEMLDFAESEIFIEKDGKRKLSIWIIDSQHDYIELLKSKGYKKEYSEAVTIFDYKNEFPEVSLPEGFTAISLEDENDIAKIHSCMWKGFDHGDSPDEDIECRRQMQSGPNFREDLATIIKAPDGEYACYAGMWLEEENGYAYLEPLCTIPEYRKMGLAAYALVNSMKKTKALGAKYCYGGVMKFYTNLGFEKVCERQLWGKTQRDGSTESLTNDSVEPSL